MAEGPVFVPRTLPGEVVDGDAEGGRIATPRIVSPSPDRVKAPCRHYKGCGGCSLQHASDTFVAEWKVDLVRSALSARGLEAPIRHLQTSPAGARRRAVFTGRRTKSGATVGFHAPGSDVICEVPDCQLLRPALRSSLGLLSEIVVVGGSRKGELRLTVTETESGLDVLVTGGKPMDMALQEKLSEFAAHGSLARLTWEDETVFAEHPPVLTFGTAPVLVPPGAFLQATLDGEAVLQVAVAEALEDAKGAVVDLFCGVGTFALPLSQSREVHAVEGVQDMLTALDAGWRHGKNLKSVSTECRDLFRRPLLQDELGRFGAAVIDPPRAGAEAQTRELAKAQLPRIAFVSCNPVTFARDAEILTTVGYGIEWIDVVDQFRWSSHVELAAKFNLS